MRIPWSWDAMRVFSEEMSLVFSLLTGRWTIPALEILVMRARSLSFCSVRPNRGVLRKHPVGLGLPTVCLYSNVPNLRLVALDRIHPKMVSHVSQIHVWRAEYSNAVVALHPIGFALAALREPTNAVLANPPNVVYACAPLDEFLVLIDWPRPLANPAVAEANNTVV